MHKDFSLGQRITTTIVINAGSKERDNEETTGSFDNNVSFKVDDWKAIEECALGLGRLNSEDKLHQDEQKPAAIPTKNTSVTQIAIAHLKPSVKPLTIPPENSGTVPSLHGKIDDYFAENVRKPAANQQEEMLTTNIQAQFIQCTIPSLPAIAGNVVAWIYEFSDSQWPQLQKRCASCKRWKGGKRSLLIKRTSRNKLGLRTTRRKGVGKVKCCLLHQPRRLIFLW